MDVPVLVFRTPPLATVTVPLNVLVPVALVSVMVLVRAVVPVTQKAKAPVVRVPPGMRRSPLIVTEDPSVQEALPLRVKSPNTGEANAVQVLADRKSTRLNSS